MKNTIELLKEKGIVEKLQRMLNIVPINLADDITKDPNMKDFQEYALKFILKEEGNDEFFDDYLNAVHKDIIEALDLKKEGSGNMLLSMLTDLFKEME